MAEKQIEVFSVGRDSLVRIANYLAPDPSTESKWSSPEKLFRGFLEKLQREVGDQGAVVKNMDYADGEIRFTVDCSEAVSARIHEVLDARDGSESEEVEEPMEA